MGSSLKGKELGVGITQRKDGRYSAKFKSVSGKRIEKYFDKLQEARKWLAEAKYEDEHGNIASSTNMTVDAWFNYWIADIKGKTSRYNTLEMYRGRYNSNINKSIGKMLISDVRAMHCQNILNVMDSEGYSGATMKATKATLSAMFSSAEENGIISASPVTKSIKCPKKKNDEVRVLTLEEQEKFLDAAKRSTNYLHFLFVLQTGVRVGELRGLKWEDVDFEMQIVHIKRSLSYNGHNASFIANEPKTISGYRHIPLTQTAYDILMEMKHRQKEMKQKLISLEFWDYVFLNAKGNPSPGDAYNGCLEKICKRAGIEKITMHTLRHTFATRCIESGMKPKTLQKILGHSKISITMDLYVHVTDDEKNKEMQKFEEMYRMA